MAFKFVALQLISGLEEIQNSSTYIRNGALNSFCAFPSQDSPLTVNINAKLPHR